MRPQRGICLLNDKKVSLVPWLWALASTNISSTYSHKRKV
jgi:hypothetical protein